MLLGWVIFELDQIQSYAAQSRRNLRPLCLPRAGLGLVSEHSKSDRCTENLQVGAGSSVELRVRSRLLPLQEPSASLICCNRCRQPSNPCPGFRPEYCNHTVCTPFHRCIMQLQGFVKKISWLGSDLEKPRPLHELPQTDLRLLEPKDTCRLFFLPQLVSPSSLRYL
ncbi:hypothetical protein OG21DRAFT_832100 [Imleria badia]|nr:hypothetical protein OG21DRAFT_832100 [Imleria badia]